MKLLAFRKISWWLLIMLAVASMMALIPKGSLPARDGHGSFEPVPTGPDRLRGETNLLRAADFAEGEVTATERINGDGHSFHTENGPERSNH